jgi:tripartite-type tricarboxylate transporter receptor subunit TctC
MFRRTLLRCAAVIWLPALPVAAQVFPAKPIRLVVPFPPGGGADVLARSLSDGLARELGQPILIDNKAGAGTAIGTNVVANSPADGYTLLLTSSAFVILPSLYPRLPYDQRAIAPVALLGRAPIVAVVRNDSPLHTAGDFLSRARAHPGKLSYGSPGNGTSSHLAAELLKVAAKVFVMHIPYRGASPMVTDLLGGQIDVGFTTLPSVAGFLSSGKLRALAVTSLHRSALLPTVPTFSEAGIKDYAAEVWYGIFAPAGTPGSVIDHLHAALLRATATDDFRERAASEGVTPAVEAPAQAQRILLDDEAKWRKVVREQSLKME